MSAGSTNVELYRRLFVHRSDVFAEQQATGAYYPVLRELTDADILQHLGGAVSYGVYVIDPEQHVTYYAEGKPHGFPKHSVKLILFDLDTYDADALAFLKRAVERMVNTATAHDPAISATGCLMLEDSGGKGYHAWLFLSQPVAARTARSWASQVATSYADMRRTTGVDGVAEWPPLEVFPKQDAVADDGYGNLVKLPFGVHAKSRARARIVPVSGWATTLEDVRPFDVALIPEPKAPAPTKSEQGGVSPFPCISKLLTEGADGGVRDVAMYHLACYMRAHGAPQHLADEWAMEVNERFTPPLEEAQVRKCVRSAYSASNAGHGCGADWLEDFCPRGPRCFAPWNDRKSVAGPTATPRERQAWRRK